MVISKDTHWDEEPRTAQEHVSVDSESMCDSLVEVESHKPCSLCKQQKPLNAFNKKFIKKANKEYYNAQCHICENAVESYQRRMKGMWGKQYQMHMKDSSSSSSSSSS